jgi:Spy/CpxP family protein refolding chaperone
MRVTWLCAVGLAVVVVAGPQAQGGTRLDEFGGKLRLNDRTQLPAVRQIFNDAGQTAGPIALEMLTLRQTLVNLELADRTDQVPAALAAYNASATRMTALEVQVYQKVFALLTPAQQGRTPDAFTFMAGFFQAAGARSGGRGR